MTQAEASEFVTSLRRTFAEFEALPMPTVAVLEGYAYGGGAELALAADLRIADEAAVMAFTEAR
jgi:methylglutaconyl-CoA hydratase